MAEAGKSRSEADLAAEVERLRRENEQLKEAQSESRRSGALRARGAGMAVLAVASALLLALSVPAIWLNRELTDTQTYVNTMAPLARDPAIQDAAAAAASDAIIQRIDTQARVEAALPPNLKQFAGPIASAVDGFIRTQTTNFVRSDTFATVWDEVNRRSHQALVAAVTGGTTASGLQLEAGTLSLDVGALADAVRGRLMATGIGPLANLPAVNIDKTVVLYHSNALAQLTGVVRAIETVAFWLPLLGLMLGAAAFVVAVDRRVAALWIGWGLLVSSLLPLQAVFLGQYYVTQSVQGLAGVPSAAVQNAYAIIFRGLVAAEQTMLVLSVVVIVAAVVAGPAAWAKALRGFFSGGIAHVGENLDLGPFGAWVGSHKPLLRALGFVTAVVLLGLTPPPRTVASIAWAAVLIVLWLALVEFLGAGVKPKEGGEKAPPADNATT